MEVKSTSSYLRKFAAEKVEIGIDGRVGAAWIAPTAKTDLAIDGQRPTFLTCHLVFLAFILFQTGYVVHPRAPSSARRGHVSGCTCVRSGRRERIVLYGAFIGVSVAFAVFQTTTFVLWTPQLSVVRGLSVSSNRRIENSESCTRSITQFEMVWGQSILA